MPGGCSKISSICGSNREFTINIKFWNRTIFGTDASKSNPKRVILSHTLHYNTPCSAETESFFQFLGRLRLNPAILFFTASGIDSWWNSEAAAAINESETLPPSPRLFYERETGSGSFCTLRLIEALRMRALICDPQVKEDCVSRIQDHGYIDYAGRDSLHLHQTIG